MSIYAGSNRCDLYKGDYRPATLYQGEQFLAGATDSEPVPLPAAVKGTYNDTAALTALGKGKQETTTGANLFDKSEVNAGSYIKGLVQTQDGFSFITNHGVGTKSTLMDIVLKPGNYFLSGESVSSDGLKCGFAVYDEATGTFIVNSSNTGLNKDFTIAEEKVYSLRFYANYNSLIDVQVTFTNVMLNTGNAALPYEPYTGGKPSPSLDYPQELVASEGTVTAAGANILDVDNANIWDVVSCTRVNGGVMSNIVNTYYCTIRTGDKDFIAAYFKPGETFTFSVPENPKDKSVAITLWGKRANGSNWYENGRIGTSVTITVPNDFVAPITSVELRFNRATTAFTDTETFFSVLQLEKGGTPTPCTKYRPATSINLPVLRAIPDNNGGWLAQDTLTPVLHMPGWYDLKRQVGAVVLGGTGNSAVTAQSVNSKGKPIPCFIINCFTGRKFKTDILCTHDKQIQVLNTGGNGPLGMLMGLSKEVAHSLNWAVDYSLIGTTAATPAAENVTAMNNYLKAQHAAGTPVTAWYILETPTTERIYLGDLKSYPRYTTLNINGDYPPEVSAKMKIQEGEK